MRAELLLVVLLFSCAGPQARLRLPEYSPHEHQRLDQLAAEQKEWERQLRIIREHADILNRGPGESCQKNPAESIGLDVHLCAELAVHLPALLTSSEMLQQELAQIRDEMTRLRESSDQRVGRDFDQRVAVFEARLWRTLVRAVVLLESVPGGD